MRGRDCERHGFAIGMPKRGAAALDDSAAPLVSPPASPKKSKHPSGGKGGKGTGKRASKQGSNASKVSYGKNGDYVLLARTYYDLKRLKRDLADNNSVFPHEYAYMALLHTHDKLSWFPVGVAPPGAIFDAPFAGFDSSKYSLDREQPADF